MNIPRDEVEMNILEPEANNCFSINFRGECQGPQARNIKTQTQFFICIHYYYYDNDNDEVAKVASLVTRPRKCYIHRLATQRSNVCACASNRATKKRPKCFHDIVLFVGHRHAINDIFLVIYIFVYVLACTTRAN